MSKTFNAGTGGSTLHQHPQQRRMRSSFTRAWIFWTNGLIVAIAVILGYRAGAPRPALRRERLNDLGVGRAIVGNQLSVLEDLESA